MTFELKNYTSLKTEWESAKLFLLDRLKQSKPKAKTLEELEPPKKDQIRFINYLFESLDKASTRSLTTVAAAKKGSKAATKEQVEEIIPPEHAAEIMTAAMALICKDIKDGFSQIATQSTTRDRIKSVIGLTRTSAPTNSEYSTYFRLLNGYLKKSLFNEASPALGFKLEHDFRFVDSAKLMGLLSKSYGLQAEYSKKALKDLPTTDTSEAEFSKYKLELPISDELITPFHDWATLSAALDTIEREELVRANVATVDKLSPERASQLQFLKVVRDKLNQMPSSQLRDNNKMAILLGALYLVREQISKEYSLGTLSSGNTYGTLTGSRVHTALTELLNVEGANPEHIESYATATNHFLRFSTIREQQFKTSHLFSNIESFNLVGALELIQDIILTARNNALDRAIAVQQLSAPKPKKTSLVSNLLGMGSSTLLGVFNLSTTADPKNSTRNAEEVKKADEVTSTAAKVS